MAVPFPPNPGGASVKTSCGAPGADVAGANLTCPVVLIGFMGCGKSSVGRALANRLGRRFDDLDERIERGAGKSVAELFAETGEPGFRELEHTQLKLALRVGSDDGGLVFQFEIHGRAPPAACGVALQAG